MYDDENYEWDEYENGGGGGWYEDPPLYTFSETFDYIDVPEFGSVPGFERPSVIGTLDPVNEESLYTQPAQDWWNPLFGIEYPVRGPEGEYGYDPTAPGARPRQTSGGGPSGGGSGASSGGGPQPPKPPSPPLAAPPGKSSWWLLAAVAIGAYLLAKERK